MRSIEELNPKGHDRRHAVSLVSYCADKATPIDAMGVIEPLSRSRDSGVSSPSMQRMARRWLLRYRPARLWINLRPGLPCILGWLAVQRGWPVTAVIAPAQIDRATPDMQPTLMELWHAVGERLEVPDVFQRDHLITGLVPLITIENIMQSSVPIMGTDVVSSDEP